MNPSPLTNCHTHIFKAKHVPPWLGRTYLPFGLYYIFNVPLIVWVFRTWFKVTGFLNHKVGWLERARRSYKQLVLFIKQNILFNTLFALVGAWVTIQVFFFLFDLAIQFFSLSDPTTNSKLADVRTWLESRGILLVGLSQGVHWLLVIILFLFVKSGRNFILFLFKRFFKAFALLPGKETTKFIRRYFLLGRFAIYKSQNDIFTRLRNQYPVGSRFVVLPMDMEFMGAGRPRESYGQQMKSLVDIKQNHPEIFKPFVFVDPRRITSQKANATQKAFFSYQAGATGQVLLDDCDVRDYIETHNFSGFKIYPALGYYPFHEDLLPVWKYAVDHDLPVLTHCIRGTIFYRGAKKNEWNKHPVFQENVAGDNKPLLLNQTRNQDFCNNFTHPLNYLCLLKEPLLRILVARANPKVQQLFGFQDAQTPLLYNLNNLKLCFGHYGGEDEWLKYFETDRDQYTPALIKYANGIDFMFSKSSNGFSHDKIAQIWKSTDWYSIISSLILQHPNVYADISYTLHDPVIWPLLRHSLERQALPGETRRLADGVLYGTDFYVVRNHKSEKQLFAELEANLDPAQVDVVARINPARFVR